MTQDEIRHAQQAFRTSFSDLLGSSQIDRLTMFGRMVGHTNITRDRLNRRLQAFLTKADAVIAEFPFRTDAFDQDPLHVLVFAGLVDQLPGEKARTSTAMALGEDLSARLARLAVFPIGEKNLAVTQAERLTNRPLTRLLRAALGHGPMDVVDQAHLETMVIDAGINAAPAHRFEPLVVRAASEASLELLDLMHDRAWESASANSELANLAMPTDDEESFWISRWERDSSLFDGQESKMYFAGDARVLLMTSAFALRLQIALATAELHSRDAAELQRAFAIDRLETSRASAFGGCLEDMLTLPELVTIDDALAFDAPAYVLRRLIEATVGDARWFESRNDTTRPLLTSYMDIAQTFGLPTLLAIASMNAPALQSKSEPDHAELLRADFATAADLVINSRQAQGLRALVASNLHALAEEWVQLGPAIVRRESGVLRSSYAIERASGLEMPTTVRQALFRATLDQDPNAYVVPDASIRTTGPTETSL